MDAASCPPSGIMLWTRRAADFACIVYEMDRARETEIDYLSLAPMSHVGQVRLCRPCPTTVRFSFHSRHGAAPPRTCGLGQLQTLAVQQTALLFDDLVGALLQ